MTTKSMKPMRWRVEPDGSIVDQDGCGVLYIHRDSDGAYLAGMQEDRVLAAAAPALLDACELMLTVYGLAQEAPHAVEVMRAAVAKAKGEK